MEKFDEKLLNMLQEKMIRDISKQDIVKIEYGDRLSLPKGFIQDVYESLDINKVKARLIENLENEMADKIANKMATEFSNDIKQIMSNKELREELRQYARSIIKGITNEVTE